MIPPEAWILVLPRPVRWHEPCSAPTSCSAPYYPFWSLLVITLDTFVIWAVAADGGDLRELV
jgi:hypothetical protein